MPEDKLKEKMMKEAAFDKMLIQNFRKIVIGSRKEYQGGDWQLKAGEHILEFLKAQEWFSYPPL